MLIVVERDTPAQSRVHCCYGHNINLNKCQVKTKLFKKQAKNMNLYQLFDLSDKMQCRNQRLHEKRVIREKRVRSE